MREALDAPALIVDVLVWAALVVALANGHDAPVASYAALMVLGIVLVAARLTAALATYVKPFAAHIPGVSTRSGLRVPAAPLSVAGAVAVVVSLLSMTSYPWLLPAQYVLSAAVVIYWLGRCADIVAMIIARQRFAGRLTGLLTDYGPRFVLHWDAPPGTTYQIRMWLDELERIDLPFVIIVRSPHCFHEAASLTDRPVILLRYLEDLDRCMVPSLRAAFYVNNGIRNQHLTRYESITHIQLNHGDSDKAPSYSPVFRMYDFNFVAGQAAIDRFAANGVWMPEHMFRIVGRPQVRDIAVAQRAIADNTSPTILYAPTWAGFTDDAHYSSLPHAAPIMDALLRRGCTVVFRPHPHAYRSAALASDCRRIQRLLAADAERSGRRHRYGADAEKNMTLTDCFNASDAMISDVSSVVVDYLFSEKPLGMVAVDGTVDEFRTGFPVARAAYVMPVTGSGPDDAEHFVDSLLSDSDLSDTRRSLKDYYLGEIPADEYGHRFVDEARAVINAR